MNRKKKSEQPVAFRNIHVIRKKSFIHKNKHIHQVKLFLSLVDLE